MAVVVVQVGQCGNQLGEELWRQLKLTTSSGAVPSPFFTRDRKARCVLVDSEPKVVAAVHTRHKEIFRAENVVYGESGRGNHWALGYYGVNDLLGHRAAEKARPFQVEKDQRRRDGCVVRDALRAIYAETRRTADAMEFEAILVLHSLVGGTGSGMATRLLEKIRYYFIEPLDSAQAVDECEEAAMMRRDGLDGMMMDKRRASYLVSVTVAPQAIGELSTQGLNAALTLHALQENADAVLLLCNDDCLRVEAVSSAGVRPRSRASCAASVSLIKACATFTEINEVFVTMLLPILLYGRSANAVGDLVLKCSPNHRELNNILTILPTPQRQYLRFKGSVTLSRFYILSGSKQHMPGVYPSAPIELLHTARSMRNPDLVTSSEEVRVPREIVKSFTETAASRRSAAAALLQQMEGVLVLNEARELNAAVLFPLLRSAAVKVKAGAFLSTFEEMGMAAECIRAAIQEVAARLSAAEDV
ncbi:putative zeta tubulin [Trypanosoma conorhini]|uniref:Putative zeta tubulin n=1 Tax=Trypanosoma conorhini TaxID=83891 RepID=A0A3R7NK27_9TRYP|nr:putative zeta tubulin [Trypanosoma conorhini]RNF23177.1 putative zeta tubulin [Trypanosoma conorhini]